MDRESLILEENPNQNPEPKLMLKPDPNLDPKLMLKPDQNPDPDPRKKLFRILNTVFFITFLHTVCQSIKFVIYFKCVRPT